jgi:hypothetical protein
MEHSAPVCPNLPSPVPQNPTNHGEASSTQRPPSTWGDPTEAFENTLWKKRHYSKLVNGSIQAIKNHPLPRGPDDEPGLLRYTQHVFKLMSHLAYLTGPDGRPIKELEEILASNTFLLSMNDILPFKVRYRYAKQLASNNIDLDTIQGEKHFNLMMYELRIYLRTLEIVVNSEPPRQSDNTTSVPFAYHPSTCPPTPGIGVGARAAPTPNVPSRTQANPASLVTMTTACGPLAPRNLFPRWTCPLRNHEYHTIQTCSDFFSISIRERRLRMKRVACFTCLGRGALCAAQYCGRFQDIPEQLLCEDCYSTNKGDCPVLNLLLCGINCHKKPPGDVLAVALESWIPQLNLSSKNIGLRLNVNPGTAPRPAPQQAETTQ